MKVLDSQIEKLCRPLSLGGELPLQFFFIIDPVVHIVSLGRQHTSHDINDSEVVSGFDFYVLDVRVSWKDHPAISILHEIHTSDPVALEVDIVIFLNDFRLKNWAYPGQKSF